MRTELAGLEVGPVRGKIGFGSAVIGRCIDRWSAISNFSLLDKNMHPPRRAPGDPARDDSCYLKIASVIARSAHFFTLEKRAFEEARPQGMRWLGMVPTPKNPSLAPNTAGAWGIHDHRVVPYRSGSCGSR